MYNSKISATGSYLPSNVVTNSDLEKYVDTNDEWIINMTGIKERRFAKGENTADLAIEAAKNILENASIKATDIDFIIVSTTTPSDLMPSLSSQVQAKIGATNAAVLDMNAACTGFIYAMDIADQYIRTGKYKNVLVIASETYSSILDFEDRSTLVLFGDGAGGVILSRAEKPGFIDSYLMGLGELGENLKVSLFRRTKELPTQSEKCKIYMNGREVFKFSSKAIISSIENVLNKNNLKIEDIDYIIPHQANYRIIKFAAERFNIPTEKFYLNLDKYGNTGSASIPIALDEFLKSGIIEKGQKILLVGFGGGLTYGSILINWEE